MKFIPLVCLIFLLGVGCTSRVERRSYQQSPIVSLNEGYIADIQIVHESYNGFDSYWQLTVRNKDGMEMYRDNRQFPARFQIYWLWDANDRLWIYNSDDGTSWYWDREGFRQFDATATINDKDLEAIYPPIDFYRVIYGS